MTKKKLNIKFNINIQLIIEIFGKKGNINFLEKSGRSEDRQIKQKVEL